MATRSTVLGRWHSVVGTLTSPAFTVPLTDTWLLKQVNIYNGNALAALVDVFVKNAASTELTFIVSQSVAPSTTLQWAGWVALGPGDVLQFDTARDGVQFWASGADLPGHV